MSIWRSIDRWINKSLQRYNVCSVAINGPCQSTCRVVNAIIHAAPTAAPWAFDRERLMTAEASSCLCLFCGAPCEFMVSAARICTRSERSEARRRITLYFANFSRDSVLAWIFWQTLVDLELALEFIIFRLAHEGLYVQEMSDNVLFYLELNFILNFAFCV